MLIVSQATVNVIDDDTDVQEGLSRLLRSFGLAVNTFSGAQEFLDQSGNFDVGCVLLDVSMPEITGPELHALMLERGCELPVIYLTGNCTISDCVRAMKLGALDFLEKPIDADLLFTAIETAITRSKNGKLNHAHKHDIQIRISSLSAREKEVMDLVIRGRLNKQIAAELCIAEKTVKVHRGRVMAKMRVRSIASLVHLCDELGMIGSGQ